jgi:hypothetical protein
MHVIRHHDVGVESAVPENLLSMVKGVGDGMKMRQPAAVESGHEGRVRLAGKDSQKKGRAD